MRGAPRPTRLVNFRRRLFVYVAKNFSTPPTSSLKPFGGDLRNDRKAVRDISPTNAMAAALIWLMGGLVEGERSYSTKSLFELVPLTEVRFGCR